MSTKPSAFGPSPRIEEEIRRIKAQFRRALAIVLGLWLSIAGFVLLALWMKWRL